MKSKPHVCDLDGRWFLLAISKNTLKCALKENP